MNRISPINPEKKSKTPTIKEHCQLYQLVADLCSAVRKKPVENQIWNHEIGDWMVCVNGFGKDQNIHPRGRESVKAEAWTVVLWYKASFAAKCNRRVTIAREIYDKGTGAPVFDINDIERIVKEEIARYG